MGLAWLSAREEARPEFTPWGWERMGAEPLWDMLGSSLRERRREVLPSMPCPALETPAVSPEQEDKLGVLDWSHHGDCRPWVSWAGGGCPRGLGTEPSPHPPPERAVLSAWLGWARAAGWVQEESMDGGNTGLTPADPSSLCALSGGAAGCCCVP